MGNDEAALFMDAVHPTRGLAARQLPGAVRREARDPANERAPTHQHSRRHRSGNRAHPVIGRQARRFWRVEGEAAFRHVFRACLSRQHALASLPVSQSGGRAAMARPARVADQAAHEPSNDAQDRAVMGPHAQASHTQCHTRQMLRHIRAIRRRHARFLAPQSRQELGSFRNSVTANFRVINPEIFGS